MGSGDATIKSDSRGSRWKTIWKRRSGEMRDGSEQRCRARLAMDSRWTSDGEARPSPPSQGKIHLHEANGPLKWSQNGAPRGHRLTAVGGGHLLGKVAPARDPVLFMFMRGTSGGAKTLRSVSLPLRAIAATV
ncbi:hypothetical protein ColTof4_07108 [Colletotrichum tofieldiae]|nr:hypothetical protein ColTof4_07108 [Colletotrichum tofieldiae]